jgi:hypothetical protein
MWGPKPWENDRAADWFAGAIEDSGIALHVRATLRKVLGVEDWDDESQTARAASYVLVQLARVYMWPIDSLKDDLSLGITALERVLLDEEYIYSEEIKNEVLAELNELKVRQDRLQ